MVQSSNFKFEECLLKHYVRVKGWLPLCKSRKEAVNKGVPSTKQRRLRYFTFCAIGAIDVLMLDVAKVLRPSEAGRFDTVVFFDRDSGAVTETEKRIPGATGFPGNFVDVVLAQGVEVNDMDEEDILAPPEDLPDIPVTREGQRLRYQHERFRNEFPFDIINLDLEEYAFKPRDPFPGKVINALRKIVQWQTRPLTGATGAKKSIDGFSLMFTTRIGPANMSAEYRMMLRDSLTANIARDPRLSDVLKNKTGMGNVQTLEASMFDEFFKIGFRKVLAGLMLEGDWYIDEMTGIKTFVFSRQFTGGSYSMLHFVMDVKRQKPSFRERAPNSGPAASALSAYSVVAQSVVTEPDLIVTDDIANAADLKPSLSEIRGRRKKYYPEDPS